LFDELTATPEEVDPTNQIILQVANVCAFAVAMFFNFASQYITQYTSSEDLASIGEKYDLTITASGYAFSIWGVIYSLMGLFVIYQALPSEWVPSRNDKLIFNDIGYLFAANLLSNSAWLIIFGFYNTYGFVGGLIDIIFMLGSALYIMYQTIKNDVDWIELVGLRATFSIYAGWLTTATILNTCFVLMDFGMRDVNNIFPNEETWGIIILWIAFLIYQTAVEVFKNPLFGAVFSWAITAIYVDASGKGTLKNLEANALVIDVLHSISLFLYAAYFAYEKWGLEQENYGILYTINEVYFNL